jgi:hypothetical protein
MHYGIPNAYNFFYYDTIDKGSISSITGIEYNAYAFFK